MHICLNTSEDNLYYTDYTILFGETKTSSIPKLCTIYPQLLSTRCICNQSVMFHNINVSKYIDYHRKKSNNILADLQVLIQATGNS